VLLVVPLAHPRALKGCSVSFDLIFATRRSTSDARAWRPPRRLLSVGQGSDDAGQTGEVTPSQLTSSFLCCCCMPATVAGA